MIVTRKKFWNALNSITAGWRVEGRDMRGWSVNCRTKPTKDCSHAWVCAGTCNELPGGYCHHYLKRIARGHQPPGASASCLCMNFPDLCLPAIQRSKHFFLRLYPSPRTSPAHLLPLLLATDGVTSFKTTSIGLPLFPQKLLSTPVQQTCPLPHPALLLVV